MKMKLVGAVFCMLVATEKVLGGNPLATHSKSSSSLIRGIILSFSLVRICPVEVALFIYLFIYLFIILPHKMNYKQNKNDNK